MRKLVAPAVLASLAALAVLLPPLPLLAAEVPIHGIQGSGSRSPLVGQVVTARGVVTAIRGDGFFLQAPDAEADADPATSEGLFVFTNNRPVAIGNLVAVTGTVTEFVPSSDPTALPLTELTNAATTVVSSSQPLPSPVTLAPHHLAPAGGPEALERLEGMRVAVDELVVAAPTGGSVLEVDAAGSSNGVFWGVLPGTPRPRREPGVDVLDPLPSGPCCVPRFDTNPELLRVDSDALGAPPLDVTAGAVVSGLSGVLTYTSRAYTLFPAPGGSPVSVAGNRVYRPVPAPGPGEATIATFNFQRFFDGADDPNVSDVGLSPLAYANRLRKASLLVRDVLRMPDVLGAVEVENLPTLTAIATKVNDDAVALGLPNPGYAAFLSEGNDVGGIDVGFLVKTTRAAVVSIAQEGKSTTFTNPSGGTELLNDRPPLVLSAMLGPPEGPRLPVTVVVNHLRSLNGIDDAADGPRVRSKRRAQAEFLARLVQARQAASPAEGLVVLGDLNAFEVSDGYVDVVGTVAGRPAPASEVVLASPDLVEPDLVNLADTEPEVERYSYAFAGSAQTLDHVLVNRALHPRVTGFWHGRVDADFPEAYRSDPDRPERLSDHDPAVVYLRLDAGAAGPSATRVVPILLDVAGRGGVRFTSELTLANRGTTRAEADLSYTAAASLSASGSGVVTQSLAPGEQLVVPDAVSYLRDRGLPIPAGGQGGSLRVSFRNLSSAGAAHASARTTAPSGSGRAGLAYPGLSPDASSARLLVFGLRENEADRTNLALVHAGTEGDLTLRVRLTSGGQSASLPDVTLGPGEWRQLNQVLAETGFADAVASVERVGGTAPFLAYAVFNDNVTSDGSYVPALATPTSSALLPVLVETPAFSSELVLANPTSESVTVALTYVESLASPVDVSVTESLAPGEQRILPNALDHLRGKGAALGPKGGSYAGSLRVLFSRPGFAGARTAAPAEGGGQYGLFYTAVDAGSFASAEAWVHGLLQDGSSRSNLALLNASSTANVTLVAEVYDGRTGARAGVTEPVTLGPGAWRQVNGILGPFGVTSGYVRVLRTSGTASFVAYGVVNDGASPGSGTNDGSYVAMEVPTP